ncbi:MAG: cell division FtsZ family protein [Bacteroidales bacterium]|jgi:cell division protein FtsZ|nr:cell division FtsZ family protein [Bacteroidales bacterium]
MDNLVSLVNFDAPKNQSSYIKVIGVGGCGSNTARYLYQSNSSHVDFIVCNTDSYHLHASPIPCKIQLGGSGLGAGTDPEVGRLAAEEKREDIKKQIGNDARMIFIAAGLGKGTGTGASPVIAQIAREIEKEINEEILIVAIVTFPNEYEGIEYSKNAKEGIKKLQEVVDATIVIDNNKINKFGEMDIDETDAMVDSILVTAVKCIAGMMTADAKVRVDFNDVKKVLRRSGIALMGIGEASGENRAEKAIHIATSSPLLDDQNYTDATNVLVSISSSPDAKVKVEEMNTIMTYLRTTITNKDLKIINSRSTNDTTLEDKIKVMIVVSGFSTEPVENTVPPPPSPSPFPPVIPPWEPIRPSDTDNTGSQPDRNKIEFPDKLPDDTFKEEINPYVGTSQTSKTTTVTPKTEKNLEEEIFKSEEGYIFATVEERIKAEQTLIHQKRLEAILELWKTEEGLQRYNNMSITELHQYVNLPPCVVEEDASVLVSSQPTITNINSKGEPDINKPAFLHDQLD